MKKIVLILLFLPAVVRGWETGIFVKKNGGEVVIKPESFFLFKQIAVGHLISLPGSTSIPRPVICKHAEDFVKEVFKPKIDEQSAVNQATVLLNGLRAKYSLSGPVRNQAERLVADVFGDKND